MNTTTKRAVLAAPALGLAAMLAMAAPAAAADGSAEGQLTPVPLNGVDGSGEAMLKVSGTTLSFDLAAQGLLADAPHAAHIHYGEDALNMCPTAEADADGNGMISTPEGAPAYGEIIVSLTTSGGTAPADALAVDRFGVGPAIDYSRADVQITEAIAEDILSGEVAVVVHGVDTNANGMYDMEGAGPSPLDASLPAEATMPALCGIMQVSQMAATPQGGVQTGDGGTSGIENAGVIGAGAAAILAGGALLARRRLTQDQV